MIREDIIPSKTEQVVPIVGLLTTPNTQVAPVIRRIEETWGSPLLITEGLSFHYTDYYAEEMGEDLVRIWYAGSRLVAPLELAGMKRRAHDWEAEFAGAASASKGTFKRCVNIDPGYVSLGQVVLASTKNTYHRIPIAEGLYAEITLIFRRGRFQALPWSYRDYVDHAAFFEAIRHSLKMFDRKGEFELPLHARSKRYTEKGFCPGQSSGPA